MKIVLVGYMGSGKSSVGKKLSEVLQIPFLDLDDEIEKIENKSISEIFRQKGEIYFRKVENSVLKQLLNKPDNFVLALGGGTPCYGDAMSFIISRQDVISVYLKTPFELLVNRLFLEKERRPLLSHISSEEALNDFIRKHLFERVYYYNQANYTIENKDESLNGTVEKVILKLL